MIKNTKIRNTKVPEFISFFDIISYPRKTKKYKGSKYAHFNFFIAIYDVYQPLNQDTL
jgi:hypothetical protein